MIQWGQLLGGVQLIRSNVVIVVRRIFVSGVELGGGSRELVVHKYGYGY